MEVGCNGYEKNFLFGVDLDYSNWNGDYSVNSNPYKYSVDLGVNYYQISLPWNQIEYEKNKYNENFIIDAEEKCNEGFKVGFDLIVADIYGREMPYDLSELKINDTNLIERFQNVIDFVVSKFPSYQTCMVSLMLANEVNDYDFESHDYEPYETFEEWWEGFSYFVQNISSYIHNNYPTIKVGVILTYYGLFKREKSFYDIVLNSIDILGVNYYNIDIDNFGVVKNPDDAFKAFELLNETYGNQIIHLQEVGVPTSSYLGGSQYNQAQFICNMLKIMDIYKSNFKMMSIFGLNDLSQKQIEEGTREYNYDAKWFREYLSSIGILDEFKIDKVGELDEHFFL